MSEKRRVLPTGVRANVDLQSAVARESFLTVATSMLVVRVVTPGACWWRHAAADAAWSDTVQLSCNNTGANYCTV